MFDDACDGLPYVLSALEILKSLLIEEKKWKERSAAKKPEKDKVYKRTLEVIKMIKEIKL